MTRDTRSNARLLAVHPVLMAREVQRSIRFDLELGFATSFIDDQRNPRYAGLKRDAVEIHIQWNEIPESSNLQDRPAYRFLVQDVDALHHEFTLRSPRALATAEATPWHSPANTPWGTREFHIHDPSDNSLQFYQLPPFSGPSDA